jgi:hypothetical protein
MVETLYEASSTKCFGDHLGREYPSQLLSLLRRKIKGIHGVDNDLPVPLLELLRNIPVSGKGDSKEDHLSLISVLNGFGMDVGTEFLRQRREGLRSTGVCDCDFDILSCEGAGERAADVTGTDNAYFMINLQSVSVC